ncbi:MAG: DUF4167 domain-containing protein [Pseudomonadota bacterium]
MRSSKSRSRNKNRGNRPSGGNIVNRVFDSSGPEGKVRGTPQQIIDKYNQLARDAQLSGDRVALENFQQHAEHYTRMLAAAQKEIEARREQQNQQNQQNEQRNNQGQQGQQGQSDQPNGQARGDRNGRADQNGRGDAARGDQPRSGGGREAGEDGQPSFEAPEGGGRKGNRGERKRSEPAEAGQGDVMDTPAAESNLVETPEAQAEAPPPQEKPKRTRTRRKAPAASEDASPERPAEEA